MPGKILIADHDSRVHGLLVPVARSAGFETETAASGDAALRMVREHDYRVLLLDLTTPRLDGASIIDELRNKVRRPAVVVIADPATASAEPPLESDVVEAILHKPYDADMLSGIIVALAAAVEEKEIEDTIRTKTRHQDAARSGKCPYCRFEFSAPPGGDVAWIRTAILLHLGRCQALPPLKDDGDLQRLAGEISENMTRHFQHGLH